jgi:hypothetical protein
MDRLGLAVILHNARKWWTLIEKNSGAEKTLSDLFIMERRSRYGR